MEWTAGVRLQRRKAKCSYSRRKVSEGTLAGRAPIDLSPTQSQIEELSGTQQKAAVFVGDQRETVYHAAFDMWLTMLGFPMAFTYTL